MSQYKPRNKPFPVTLKKDLAYETIKEMILSHQLHPGDVISEQMLADELQVSRTPVREALLTLENEGLVKIVPMRGVFVTDITIRDVLEIYEIREALECLAVRKAALVEDQSLLDSLAAVLEAAGQDIRQHSYHRLFEADIDLHRFILDAARNTRLSQMADLLRDQIHRVRVLSPRVEGRIEATIAEHLAVIAALRQRDPDLAEQKLREHLRNARDNMVKFLSS